MSSGAASNNLAMAFLGELTHEAETTRKILERVPADKFGYKPHEKSMTMGRLAVHVAEMIDWITETCTKDGIDFSTMDFTPYDPKSTDDLLAYFDKNLAKANESLTATTDAQMMETWTMRNGEQIYMALSKIQTLRGMVFNHIWHHRGQLSVYLRLNDIPVPSIYGPSADEGQM